MRSTLALIISAALASASCQSSAASQIEPAPATSQIEPASDSQTKPAPANSQTGAAPTETSTPLSRAITAHLNADDSGMGALISHFESKNPGHQLNWKPAVTSFTASGPAVAFVQRGEGSVSFVQGGRSIDLSFDKQSEFSIGDLFCLQANERCEFSAPADLLVFTLPKPLNGNLPKIIRPDWDEKITDTPGGCATEGDAYRRILLTWQGKNGPYLSRQINAHRVRIHDSFTHYHPLTGGFDEFYLIQEAPAGARLIVSEKLDTILDPGDLTTADADVLLREIPLHEGDLIYLPRGVVHRGLGGAVVQVITVPGFVPGAEIAVDQELQTINGHLKLKGNRALPFHRVADFVEVTATLNQETQIRIGGKPFTTLRLDRRLPDLWPIRNAAGHAVTRVWPREGSVGEQGDHPHHQSLWFTHGDLSGMDFWHDPKLKVRQVSVKRTSGKSKGVLETKNEWLNAQGVAIGTDHRRITAFTTGDVRGIDFDITMIAGAGGLRFGDTKEGTFGMRMASGLVADLGGALQNNNKKIGKHVWGQPARWIQAQGQIAGTPAAVVMAGHKENPRHPTRWQARNYGLLAANPFGLHDFAGKPKGTGDLQIQGGESVRFQYRVLVFARHPDPQEIEKLLAGFSSAPKR